LGEPFINWYEKIACFSALVLIRPELGNTHGREQFKQARPLLASQFERLQIVSFRIILLGMNQQVATDSVEFRNDTALAGLAARDKRCRR
jgi:hypothetical protein